MRFRRWAAVAAAVATIGLGVAPQAIGTASAATQGGSGSAFTASKAINRTNVVDGRTVVVDPPATDTSAVTTNAAGQRARDFKVSVSQTKNLQDHQVIKVSWTGAHPTSGLVSNQQGPNADQQEYPVVLMECRGIESASKPINPDTCWTNSPGEREEQGFGGGIPNLWSLDQYATTAVRSQAFPGVPVGANGRPSVSDSCSSIGYWEHFVGVDNTDYPVGPPLGSGPGCENTPSGMSQNQATGILPGDTTYAVTGSDGSGSAGFSINTADVNAALGCSVTVACSLVVIPIEGISCDPAGVPSSVGATSADIQSETSTCEAGEPDGVADPFPTPGQVNTSGQTTPYALNGNSWFFASNWRNRVSIPLSFAVSPDICATASSGTPLNVFGSELQAEATDQWNPYLCQGKGGFDVTHVQTAEPEAKNLLAAGSVEAAFQAMPASEDSATFFADPTVQAPVGLTGFAIAFVVDGANGQPVTTLNLDARLVAKLMTESYLGSPLTRSVWADQQAQADADNAQITKDRAAARQDLANAATDSDPAQKKADTDAADALLAAIPGLQADAAKNTAGAKVYPAVATTAECSDVAGHEVGGGAGVAPTCSDGKDRIGNPLTIFDDPEFQALNPGLGITDTNPFGENPEGAAELFNIIGQSDVITALTSYINADPEARAWINGQPDPWGMSVNPAYKGIALPTSSWPLLDNVTAGPPYDDSQNGYACLAAENVGARQPFRPTLDGPEANLAQVALNLQFGIANAENGCTAPEQGVQQWTTIGQERVGARFVLGVVPLALADEYQLHTASLESFRSPSAPADFTDGSNRVFVAPDDASLKAAAGLLQPDVHAGTWTLPYSDFPTDASAAGAYPGTMLVSMDVPTSGLGASDAADFARYLTFASGPGQDPGTGSGQLPAGYLPITAADGLGNQVAYDTAAAGDIRAQNCMVPSLSGGAQVGPDCSPSAPGSSSSAASSGTGGSGGSGGLNGSGTSSSSSTAASSPTSANGAPNTASKLAASNPGGTGGTGTRGSTPGGGGAPTQVVALAGGGRTPGFGAGVGAVALPVALGVLILGLGYTGSTRFLGTSVGRRMKTRLKLKKGMSFGKLLHLARSKP